MWTRRSAAIFVGSLALVCTTAWAAKPANTKANTKATPKADAAVSSDPYQRLCDAYLNGKWEDLEKGLRGGKDPAGLSADQRTELAAIRRAVTEGRPAWWQSCKAGNKGAIHPMVWGRTLDLTFDPAGKGGMQMNFSGNRMLLTVSWPVAEMDNPQHAEHGFSKGDLNHLSVWATLGMALCWSQVTPQALANLTEQDKVRLIRYQDFRGNVTGLYYGTPKARRWGEFLYLLAWKEKYAKMPNVNSRKAAGAMFLAEVLDDPSKYPSLPLPKTVPADAAEEKLAEHYRNWIEKHGWTVAEDLALRKAIQAFAAANESGIYRTQQVTLPNKLKVSLDPEADAPLRAKRDSWLKSQVKKALSPAGA